VTRYNPITSGFGEVFLLGATLRCKSRSVHR